jgi:hypothetical protein
MTWVSVIFHLPPPVCIIVLIYHYLEQLAIYEFAIIPIGSFSNMWLGNYSSSVLRLNICPLRVAK